MARQVIGLLRRLPMLFAQMARRPVPDEVMRRWTDPLLRDPAVRRDLLAYCRGSFDKSELVRHGGVAGLHRGDARVVVS